MVESDNTRYNQVLKTLTEISNAERVADDVLRKGHQIKSTTTMKNGEKNIRKKNQKNTGCIKIHKKLNVQAFCHQ